MTRYHCYIEWCESVYCSNIDAGTPEKAAELAAREHGIAGTWTVVPMAGTSPLQVGVTEHTTYEAQRL